MVTKMSKKEYKEFLKNAEIMLKHIEKEPVLPKDEKRLNNSPFKAIQDLAPAMFAISIGSMVLNEFAKSLNSGEKGGKKWGEK